MKARHILILTLLLLLGSCGSSQISMNNLVGIKKGMSPVQADSLIDADTLCSYRFEIGGVNYLVHSFTMQVFYEEHPTKMGNDNQGGFDDTHTNNSGYNPQPSVPPSIKSDPFPQSTYASKHLLFSPYYLIFKNNSLYFWGFLFEQSREDDPALLAISKKLLDIQNSNTGEKK